mmetsp:Transcript_63298/g.175497  ORF Transcript_63298/g.175497 Transcript_63298/m.175497 type:complete len:266 (+) Transcript_63298:424-1221(+)
MTATQTPSSCIMTSACGETRHLTTLASVQRCKIFFGALSRLAATTWVGIPTWPRLLHQLFSLWLTIMGSQRPWSRSQPLRIQSVPSRGRARHSSGTASWAVLNGCSHCGPRAMAIWRGSFGRSLRSLPSLFRSTVPGPSSRSLPTLSVRWEASLLRQCCAGAAPVETGSLTRTLLLLSSSSQRCAGNCPSFSCGLWNPCSWGGLRVLVARMCLGATSRWHCAVLALLQHSAPGGRSSSCLVPTTRRTACGREATRSLLKYLQLDS